MSDRSVMHPTPDSLVIRIPCAFTRGDVEAPTWPEIRKGMLDNIRACYEDRIEYEIRRLGWRT